MTSEALNRDFFDDDIRASDDLFRHVNGAWLARAKIPEDRSGWGAFYELREASEAAVRQIIETRDAEGEGADAARIANLYASFMDTEAVEKLGIAPLRRTCANATSMMWRRRSSGGSGWARAP